MIISRRTALLVAIPVLVCGLFLARIEIIRGKLFQPKSLSVFIFDIGQGDAIFIDGPEKQVLIDGGPDSAVLQKLQSVMLPWDRSIDLVINTHPHADHLMGLVPVLENYHVAQAADSGQGYTTPEFHEYEKLAPESLHFKDGDTYDLGNGARLDIIWPSMPYEKAELDDPNDGSVAVLLTYGETTILLTGDAGIAQEADWVLPHVDVLKVGHHGSRTSSSEQLLKMISPNTAIISVGVGNSYGLPDEDVLARLTKFGVTTYRTDTNGDVRVTSSGGEPTVDGL
ncbi:MAG: MBL fold metallo-hydrolase [Patescibacteria group bacterium]|jgi:competence protein ComEC